MKRALTSMALVLAAAGIPAAASTYVPVSDAALAERAALIVEGRVTAVQPADGVSGLPATAYRVRVERAIQGDAPGDTLTVRVPGGMAADGTVAVVWGAPRFTPGEWLLLFLTPRADGSWDLLHLGLGAFRVLTTRSAGTVALPEVGARPRDHARFLAWLSTPAAERPAADYFTTAAPGELRTLRERFTLFQFGGHNMRWFEFDGGGSVPFVAQAAGQPGLAGGGFAEFQTALAAWNDDPGSTIQLVYGGTTSTPGNLHANNGINELTFDDPEKEITPFDCAHGGFLAYTVAFGNRNVTGSFRGLTFTRILGSHVVTNRNIACYLQRPGASSAFANLLTHELGHSVGLNHSCGDAKSPPCADDAALDDAVMRAYIHDDGRGAQLGSDDRTALRLLYSTAPAPAERCAKDAHTLCLGGRFTVQVDWRNQYDGTSGKGVAIPNSTQTGFFSFGDPGNVELMVKVLDLGDANKVFYGELTDLQFEIVIRDTLLHEVRSYSNTAGNCGGIDESAFAPLTVTPRRASPGGCRPDRDTLCLLNGRFAVSVDWSNPGNGTSGPGLPASLSALSGTFYFTDPGNIELIAKLIDFGDRIAFFYGALSDLPYTIHVKDTASGVEKMYQSTAGRLCGGLDNHAF